MRHSTIAKLIGFLLPYTLWSNSAISKNVNNHFFSTQLEEILNHKKHTLIKDLFTKKALKKFEKNYVSFIQDYKDTKWSIKTIRINPKKFLMDIKINSTRKIGDQVYNLHSKQKVQIETFNNKIKNYKVIDEESILHSQESPLIVKIISPDKVLTGERYEINLIIEKPLDNLFTASGMIVLKNNESINISNNQFGIKPNQSGGLFKYIQAPLEPGFQTISAIITHPEGIYSITKKIKVGL